MIPMTRTDRRLPEMNAGEKLEEAQDRRRPALHRAAAAVLGSIAGQAHGRARHRPAFHLCGDPGGAAGTRLCAIDKKRFVPEDKGRRGHGVSRKLLRRYVEYDFTADLEEQLDRSLNHEMAWQRPDGDFWKRFTAAVDDIKDLRIAQVLDALDECLAPHLFPPREDGCDPR